jgi:hypothetical protein
MAVAAFDANTYQYQRTNDKDYQDYAEHNIAGLAAGRLFHNLQFLMLIATRFERKPLTESSQGSIMAGRTRRKQSHRASNHAIIKTHEFC